MVPTLTVLVSWPPLYASSLSLSVSKPHYAVACPPPATLFHALSASDARAPPVKTNSMSRVDAGTAASYWV